MSYFEFDNRLAQKILKAAGYYSGDIDGIFGPRTMEGANLLLERHESSLMMDAGTTNPMRRVIASVQLILTFAGYEPGAVDGFWGNRTQGAAEEWEHVYLHGFTLLLDRTPVKEKTVADIFPSQNKVVDFYGTPGEGGTVEQQLTVIECPFDLIIEWDPDETTRSIRIHEKCADAVEEALTRIWDAYGPKEINRLNLNLYSGSYAPRRMRGGTSWSMHAFGCAIDFWASQNGLTTRCPNAGFCADEYIEYFDIWEEMGFISLGREIGRDWMHVQGATLD